MKKLRARPVTKAEWFYLGCLALGAVAALLAVSFTASGTRRPDHPSSVLEAPGVVPWYDLTKVTFVKRAGATALEFGDAVIALDGKPIKLRGYITPLQLGLNQTHFILSPKPPSCGFCVPAGADEMVEVFTATPVRYSLEPVTVAGTFAVLRNDPGGMFYRLAAATPFVAEGRL